jgi:hypothetical protein
LAAGLEGSEIGEFLGSIAQSTDQMATEGVSVDQGSLRGMMGAITALGGFFGEGRGGERAGAALGALGKSFSGGDRFQQAMAGRAITGAAPNADVFGVETRRELGLFGGLDPENKADKELLAGLRSEKGGKGGDAFADALSVSAEDIINGMFQETLTRTKGQSKGARAFEFGKATGLKGRAGLGIFNKLAGGKQLTKAETKKFETAQMTPQELQGLANEKLDNQFGELVRISTKLEDVNNTLQENVTTILADSESWLEKIAGKMGIDTTDTGVSENRYGQKSSVIEKAFAKLIPEWMGGISSDEYQSSYGSGGPDPLVEKASRRATQSTLWRADMPGGYSPQQSDVVGDTLKDATVKDSTVAMKAMTESLKSLATRARGMPAGPHRIPATGKK